MKITRKSFLQLLAGLVPGSAWAATAPVPIFLPKPIPGRLMASREFTALNRKQAQRIATHYGLPAPEADSITPAELFNARASMVKRTSKVPIGFGAVAANQSK